MTKDVTIGFPRMKTEAGEKRVFLPDFIQFLTQQGAEIYLEEGYGSRSGYTLDDYQSGSTHVHMCSREQAFQKDYVMILRSPKLEEFNLLARKLPDFHAALPHSPQASGVTEGIRSQIHLSG